VAVISIKRKGPPSSHLARAKGIKTMHELHQPQAQGKGNPDAGDRETTSSVPNNSELLEFSLPTRPCEQCGKSFDRRKHGGGSPQRFCNQDCRIAWHAAQRKPACTLEPTAAATLPKQSSKNARDNTSEDINWNDRKSVVVSERLEISIYRNGRAGLIICQRSPGGNCSIVISNTSVKHFIGKLVELATSSDVGETMVPAPFRECADKRRRPAPCTKADFARAIRAAKQEGAAEVELRLGDQASFLIRIAPSTKSNPLLESAGEIIL
jgi:hypothetical protein